ncbi:MAG: Transcriptional regulator, PaaX family [Parcubacteria group bacterium Gr01-1014_17]|nr:MAG: Transcriptional regulator, PaaX family [Parcubacteria group bacterium Gr01-1014_17]
MGKLEQKVKQRAKKKNVAGIILRIVAGAGLLSAALVAPNALKAMKTLGILPHGRQKEVVRRAQARLVTQKLISRNSRGFLRLTSQGEEKLEYLKRNNFERFRMTLPPRWDKKWRLFIFDIKEERRRDRDYIRRTLENMGAVPLQKSVWVYPHDCEDMIALLKVDFKVGNNLLYIIADEIENDRSLREHFNLPLQS